MSISSTSAHHTEHPLTFPASSRDFLFWMACPVNDFTSKAPAMPAKGTIAKMRNVSTQEYTNATIIENIIPTPVSISSPRRAPVAPCTLDASSANLVVRAPLELRSSSNHPISCRSMALKERERSLAVRVSPDMLKHICYVSKSVGGVASHH